jgi:hypothetical protein
MYTFMLMGGARLELGRGFLLPNASVDAELDAVAECALGDHLDNLKQPLAEGTLPQTVTQPPDYVLELRQRPKASEDEVLAYIGSKTYWAYRLARRLVVFNRTDALRLGVMMQDVRRLAEAYEDERWHFEGERYSDGFMLRASRLLMQQGPRMLGRAVSGPVFDVADGLRDPRYQASTAHLRKAYGFLQGDKPDYENAAKEAVIALESQARRLTGQSTLGKAADALERQKLVAPPVAKVLRAMYEYRSRTPGVGHGSEAPPGTEASEARLVVNLCSSALLHLVETE